jgi:hypothetical protein
MEISVHVSFVALVVITLLLIIDSELQEGLPQLKKPTNS